VDGNNHENYKSIGIRTQGDAMSTGPEIFLPVKLKDYSTNQETTLIYNMVQFLLFVALKLAKNYKFVKSLK